MLRALYERGIEPDLIVGTSVGAVNGSFIASRPCAPAATEELAGIWHRLDRDQIFPLHPVAGFLGFFGARRYLVPERGLHDLLVEHIEFERLEQAGVPFHVITTDVLTGSEVRLSRGPALDAVMASAAIPGVFPPVEWGHRHLMDGGIANHAPISDAVELGAERVYVLSTGAACELSGPPRGALGMILHSMNLLLMRRMQVEVELLADRAELIVLPPPCRPGVSPIDFSRSDELIQRGLEDSTTFLDWLESGSIEDSASGLDDAAGALAFSDRELEPDRPAALDVPANESMSREGYKRRETLERVLGPTGHQVSCRRCFELVDEYVELELVGIEASSLLPGLRTHLEGCSACNEDHESLRALLVQLASERE
jgi:NTE family protein